MELRQRWRILLHHLQHPVQPGLQLRVLPGLVILRRDKQFHFRIRPIVLHAPRHIIKLVAELVAPKLGNRIADPACGTGGFLLGAYQYLVTQLDKDHSKLPPDEDGFIRNTVSALLNEKTKQILNDSLYGYDIDVTMVRLGLMNLMMHST